MHTKAWCTCKGVVLPRQAIAFFNTFSSPLHLYTLFHYLRYIVMRQKQNCLSANWIAPADNIRNIFRLISSSFVSDLESLVNEPGNCCKIIVVVYNWPPWVSEDGVLLGHSKNQLWLQFLGLTLWRSSLSLLLCFSASVFSCKKIVKHQKEQLIYVL